MLLDNSNQLKRNEPPYIGTRFHSLSSLHCKKTTIGLSISKNLPQKRTPFVLRIIKAIWKNIRTFVITVNCKADQPLPDCFTGKYTSAGNTSAPSVGISGYGHA